MSLSTLASSTCSEEACPSRRASTALMLPRRARRLQVSTKSFLCEALCRVNRLLMLWTMVMRSTSSMPRVRITSSRVLGGKAVRRRVLAACLTSVALSAGSC